MCFSKMTVTKFLLGVTTVTIFGLGTFTFTAPAKAAGSSLSNLQSSDSSLSNSQSSDNSLSKSQSSMYADALLLSKKIETLKPANVPTFQDGDQEISVTKIDLRANPDPKIAEKEEQEFTRRIFEITKHISKLMSLKANFVLPTKMNLSDQDYMMAAEYLDNPFSMHSQGQLNASLIKRLKKLYKDPTEFATMKILTKMALLYFPEMANAFQEMGIDYKKYSKTSQYLVEPTVCGYTAKEVLALSDEETNAIFSLEDQIKLISLLTGHF
ncbi:MAG: hypothetical protein HQK52_13515 [Oligoflexia bacterium]|nr:hypothetical protein [Oligoflexia bacterium]